MERTADGERFKVCLLAAAEIYGKAVGPQVASVWWDALKRFDIGAVEDAFARHLRNPDTGQWMPKPADIIRMIDGTSADSALVAWAKVDKAVRQIGCYTSIVFDDALIHRVIEDMGGWVGLGSKNDDDWPFVANEFRNRYRGFRSVGKQPEYRRHLIGIVEAENSRKGISLTQIMMWGDQLLCKQVMEGGVQKPMIGFTSIAIAVANSIPPELPPPSLQLVKTPEATPETAA